MVKEPKFQLYYAEGRHYKLYQLYPSLILTEFVQV
jgi:hypothetical protein